MQCLQLRFDLDSTAVQLQFNHSTTITALDVPVIRKCRSDNVWKAVRRENCKIEQKLTTSLSIKEVHLRKYVFKYMYIY